MERQKPTWPGWETVHLIGQGSYGAVYEIQRELVDGAVAKAALKVISIPQRAGDIAEMRADGYDDESITSTFHSHLKSIVGEYSTMQKMNGCSNIVNCDDVHYESHTDGFGWDVYIKMELLTPLVDSLQNPISEKTVVKVGTDICTALELCQRHGVIHRDIKPQNIFISAHGDYKLGDFGIAKTVEKTTGGTITGTYKYMAPEVYNNQPYGAAADQYSLGLVLYWMLNERRLPFVPLGKVVVGAENQARDRRFSGEAIPAPRHGSEALKQIVLKACAYNPKERFSNASEMLAALKALGKPASIVAADERSQVVSQNLSNDHVGDETIGILHVSAWEKRKEPGNSVIAAGDTQTEANHSENKSAGVKEPVADEEDRSKGQDAVEEKRTVEKPLPKKNTVAKIAAIAAVLLIIILLLRSCFDGAEMPTATEPEDTMPPTTAVTEAPTDLTTEPLVTEPEETLPVQLEWSGWMDALPEYVDSAIYEVEEQTLYRSRKLETTSSTTSNKMDGWEFVKTVEGTGDFGPWSEWSTTKVAGNDNREVESQTRYRYRAKETTTSSSSTKSDWTLYDTTYSWGNYGSWSGWSTTKVSASDSRQVETKTQYSYRDKEYTTSSSKSLSGWTLYNTTYGQWGNAQTTTTKPTESDTLRITATTQTGWGYHHWCNQYSDGSWNIDSIQYGIQSHWHGYTSGKALPAFSLADHGGNQAYGGTGSGALPCGFNFYIWFRNPGADTYSYTYETRTVTYHFYRYPDKWTSWSDTPVKESADREVKTQTMYRYRDRSQVATYHFYRWGSWSDWSKTAISATDNRQVENAKYYRYRDRVTERTHYFQRWTDWTDFLPYEVEASETTEVETKQQFRFRSRSNEGDT